MWRCLEKAPAARYRDAGQVYEALRTVQTWPAAPGGARKGGQPRRWALALSLGLVALAGGALFWNLGGGAERRPGAERDAGASTAVETDLRSIAVLPLRNLSGDPEQEYFADGMTEALIAELSTIPDLNVISRTSVMRFKWSDEPIPRIAEDLGVKALVEGSVLRSGDTVRIRAGLVATDPERRLWSDSFDRPLRDVLAVHNEVARAIALAIKGTFEPGEQGRIASRHEIDAASYDAYLRARQHWNARTPRDLRQAIELFELSTRLDPGFAAPWAGLAQTWVLAPKAGLAPAAEAMPAAKEAATTALELDPASSDAYAALGYALGLYDRDWGAAEKAFQRALALNPSNSTAHFWYAAILAADQRLVLAVSEARRAEQLDPLAPIVAAGVSWMLHFADLHEEAAAQARRTLEIDPNFLWGRVRLGIALEQLGRYDEAIQELRRAVEISGDEDADVMAALGHAYGTAGRREQARAVLRHLDDLDARGHVPAYARAWVHLGLGELEDAIQWLERAVAAREWDAAFLAVEPWVDPLRGDPRFEDLVEAIGTD